MSLEEVNLNRMIKTIFASMLIIVGLAFIFHKQIAFIIYNNRSEPEITRSMIEENSKKETAIYDEGIRALSSADIIKKRMENRPIDYIGLLSVPELGLKEPIINELSDYSLTMGAATHYRNQVMGGPTNYVLASHFSYLNENMLFSPLYYQLNQGNNKQDIYMTDLKNVYIYETIEYRVVDNDNTQYIQPNYGDGESLVTLYTCNYYTEAGKIILQGKLKSVVDIDEYSNDEIEELFFK